MSGGRIDADDQVEALHCPRRLSEIREVRPEVYNIFKECLIISPWFLLQTEKFETIETEERLKIRQAA